MVEAETGEVAYPRYIASKRDRRILNQYVKTYHVFPIPGDLGLYGLQSGFYLISPDMHSLLKSTAHSQLITCLFTTGSRLTYPGAGVIKMKFLVCVGEYCIESLFPHTGFL